MIERLTAARLAAITREDELLGKLVDGGQGNRSGGKIDTLKQDESRAQSDLAQKGARVGQAEATRQASQSQLANCPVDVDCAANLAKSIDDLAQARTDETTARTDLRKTQDELAVARAEADQLADRAAETADSILSDYQHDLLTLQQSLGPPTPAKEKGGLAPLPGQ
jgi:chromosome segregation ATPase